MGTKKGGLFPLLYFPRHANGGNGSGNGYQRDDHGAGDRGQNRPDSFRQESQGTNADQYNKEYTKKFFHIFVF